MAISKFKNIQQVLDSVVKNHHLEYPIKKEQLFNEWDSIVGKSLSEKCIPKKIENKVIFLKAKNSIWRNELALLQNDLLLMIQNKFGKDFITKIIFI